MAKQYGKTMGIAKACGKLAFSSGKDAAALPALTFRLEAKRTANNPQKNNAVVDEVIMWLAPYFLLEGGKGLEKATISLDPFVAFPLAVFFEQQGVKIVMALRRSKGVSPVAAKSNFGEVLLAAGESGMEVPGRTDSMRLRRMFVCLHLSARPEASCVCASLLDGSVVRDHLMTVRVCARDVGRRAMRRRIVPVC